MRFVRLIVVMSFLAALGCGNETLPSDLSKDEARAIVHAGKADLPDFCGESGWYADGVCDDFCSEPDPDCATPCAAAGGECIGVYPGSCADGVIGDGATYSCGDGVGVMCCLPAT